MTALLLLLLLFFSIRARVDKRVQNGVIPLTRSILSALEMSFIIKRYTNLLLLLLLLLESTLAMLNAIPASLTSKVNVPARPTKPFFNPVP